MAKTALPRRCLSYLWKKKCGDVEESQLEETLLEKPVKNPNKEPAWLWMLPLLAWNGVGSILASSICEDSCTALSF